MWHSRPPSESWIDERVRRRKCSAKGPLCLRNLLIINGRNFETVEDRPDEAAVHENDRTWAGTINAFWFANSKICHDTFSGRSDCGSDPHIRGFADGSPLAGYVAANDGGSLKKVGMAHEFGHIGQLHSPDKSHYEGGYPSNVLPLMRSGYDSQWNYQDIGEWLTKDEWKTFNNKMAEHEE